MTSASAQARPEPESQDAFKSALRVFRDWRRSRPFWGGLLVTLAGLPIMYFPYNDLNVGALRIHMATTAGAGALIIGLLLLALGISAWFQPLIRIFAGIAAIVLALVSLPISNFGGFGLGLFPGLIGGALLCSWAPLKQPETASAEGAPAEAAGPGPLRDPYQKFEGPEAKLTELMKAEDPTAATPTVPAQASEREPAAHEPAREAEHGE